MKDTKFQLSITKIMSSRPTNTDMGWEYQYSYGWMSLLRDSALDPHKATAKKRFNLAIEPCHLVTEHILPTVSGSPV